LAQITVSIVQEFTVWGGGEVTRQFVEITTDPENIASQRVIQANGGVLVERFIKPPQFGSKQGLRFRIALECERSGT
jgi:RimJ/RimL family protein N-acetyltransferase